METATFIYMLIEAIVLLVPLATLFIKVGGYKKMLDDVDVRTKGYTEWRAESIAKISQLEFQATSQQHLLDEINKNIVSIATKMDLLLDNKLNIKG